MIAVQEELQNVREGARDHQSEPRLETITSDSERPDLGVQERPRPRYRRERKTRGGLGRKDLENS